MPLKTVLSIQCNFYFILLSVIAELALRIFFLVLQESLERVVLYNPVKQMDEYWTHYLLLMTVLVFLIVKTLTCCLILIQEQKDPFLVVESLFSLEF